MLNPVSDADFEQRVIKAQGDVIVDFWAPWCGPCRAVQPVLEQIDSERPDVQVVSLNIDENPRTTAAYGVLSIPTVIRFRDGAEVARAVGAQPKAGLLAALGL